MDHLHIEHSRIERLAFQLWEERGSPLGSPAEDWLRAEEQLRSERLSELPLFSLSMGSTAE
jgi:hypothetical protein